MASTTELVTNSVADLTEEKPHRKPFKSMTWTEKFRYSRQLITVEPLVACYLIAAAFATPALQGLELDQACRVNLEFNDTVCDAVLKGEHENYTDENNQIQIVISDMHSWQNSLQQVVPVILILFCGSYSDRHKIRKPFMLIPVFGEFFAVAGLILCVIFKRSWPVEVVGIASTVVPSFFGAATTFLMAIFAYLADVSSVEMRTLRIGIVQIVLNLITPIANPISALLYDHAGYIGSFVLTAVFYALGLFYGFFFIKEPRTPTEVNLKRGFLADFFDPRAAIDTFSFLLRKIPGNNRLNILLVLLVYFVSTGVAYGEFTLIFLFTQSVLSWTPVEFGYYSTGNILIHLLGTAIGLPIFMKFFHMSDYLIIVLSFLDKIVSNIIFGFTKTATVFYIATVVSIITSISTIALRSLITKIVTEDNLGKALSLFGICEGVAGAVGVPVYNSAVYRNTVETNPQAFYFVGSVLHVGLIAVILFMYFKDMRRKPKTKELKSSVNSDSTQTTHM